MLLAKATADLKKEKGAIAVVVRIAQHHHPRLS